MNPNMPLVLPQENLCAIRCFLMAERAWPDGITDSAELLKDYLLREEQRINNLPDYKLIEAARAHHDSRRRERFLSWSWRYESVALSDFGTWKTVGGLPAIACRCSAVEAAEFIRQNPNASRFTSDPGEQEEYAKHVTRIQMQATYSSVIRSIPLLAALVAERDHRGRERCEPVKYSCEDGSHRAIAMALADHESISVWIAS
jgi:hypothetical protein